MNEYALVVDGVVKEVRKLASRPDDATHKGVVWLPVEREEETFDPRNQTLGLWETVLEPTRLLKIRRATALPRTEMLENVIAERERRLALGFDYDFGDARGVHHIGTTPADMAGWDEVSKAATALVGLGQGSQTINVVTDTGPVVVTASEWLQILVAATIARQPIWAASFAIQAMDPIPVDYADNSRWT
jgi:hypothetical protein